MIFSKILQSVSLQKTEGGFLIKFPYKDFMGEPIEVFIGSNNGQIVLEDLGQTAGCLFSTNQYAETAEGHRLLKSIAKAYAVTMDYDRGILRRELPTESNLAEFFDFIKILVAMHTVMPELQRPRRVVQRRVHLASRLSRDVKQLQLPMYVQKRAPVRGKRASWTVEYRYSLAKKGTDSDILIACADLSLKKPIDEAAYVLAMAIDVKDLQIDRTLRVVYDVNGSGPEARQAAGLIDDNQSRFGYSAFNYADADDKDRWTSMTRQELSVISEGRAPLI